MGSGKIILLNGASSAGKSSIVRALQTILDEAYLEAGIDKFLFMLPTDYLMKAHLWHEVIGYERGDHDELLPKSGQSWTSTDARNAPSYCRIGTCWQ